MKRRRRAFNVFVVTLVLVLSFGATACGAETEPPYSPSYSNVWSNDATYHWHAPIRNAADVPKDKAEHTYVNGVCSVCGYEKTKPHEHSWYTTWSNDETYHWHSPQCNDTDILKDEAEHAYVNDVCSVCGYEKMKPHEHSWYTAWSKNETYHWHLPICNDTDAVKDEAKHTYVNNICSVCGYNRTPDPARLPRTDFKDVGEKFNSVVAPLYDAAEAILRDLVENGDVQLREGRNTRIIGIRYTGPSFQIIIREDVYINTMGEKAEFLQQERGVELKNFGAFYNESYLAYRNFLWAERRSQSRADYEELILPYAERSAELILAQYEAYKANKEINILNYGKQLVLSAQSSLSEAYDKIITNLNSVLVKRNYPSITDQDLEIGFGGNVYWEIVHRWILIQVHIGTLDYHFYISFNEDGAFTEDYINYHEGAVRTGYTPVDPDQLNPKNEEYSELFENLKIEEIDLSDIKDRYNYDGIGSALYSPDGEDTFLYF